MTLRLTRRQLITAGLTSVTSAAGLTLASKLADATIKLKSLL